MGACLQANQARQGLPISLITKGTANSSPIKVICLLAQTLLWGRVMSHGAQTHRLRIGRYSEHGRIYMVTITCLQRIPHFADWHSGRCVVHGMQAVADQADTLCFVIMPDHIHWLLQLTDQGQLSTVIQKMKSISTRSWHAETRTDSPMWQRGFHDRALRREQDVLPAARYIVANPVRAGIVTNCRQYPLWDAVWL